MEHALAGDWDAVAVLYHEDAIQVLPDTPPVQGRDAIRAAEGEAGDRVNVTAE